MKPNYWLEFKVDDMGFDAHLTLHWFGDSLEPDSWAMLEQWMHREQLTRYVSFVKPIDIAIFGPPEELVPVVLVDVLNDVTKIKEMLDQNFPSPSEYSWTPHITLKHIGRVPIHIPEVIKIGPLSLQMKER